MDWVIGDWETDTLIDAEADTLRDLNSKLEVERRAWLPPRSHSVFYIWTAIWELTFYPSFYLKALSFPRLALCRGVAVLMLGFPWSLDPNQDMEGQIRQEREVVTVGKRRTSNQKEWEGRPHYYYCYITHFHSFIQQVMMYVTPSPAPIYHFKCWLSKKPRWRRPPVLRPTVAYWSIERLLLLGSKSFLLD